MMGLRFHKVDVPGDAIIESARLEFRTLYKRTGDTTIKLRGDLSANSPALQYRTGELSDRTRTEASVNWSPEVSDPGELVTSEDVSDIVAEIVGQDGWSAKNAMTFLLERVSGTSFRDFHAFDNDPNKVARLVIDYRAATPPGKRKVRDELADVIANMTSSGGTPVVDAYYEAASYLLGGNVEYGRTRGADRRSPDGQTYPYDLRSQ